MISSSFCIAASVVTMRGGASAAITALADRRHRAGSRLPVIKYFEIRWNLAHGVDAQAGVFVGAYHYYLTLNHLVHASWGSSECCGCWHAT